MKKLQLVLLVVLSLLPLEIAPASKTKSASVNMDAIMKAKPDVKKHFALYLYFRAQPLLLEINGISADGVKPVQQMVTYSSRFCISSKDKTLKEAVISLETQLNTNVSLKLGQEEESGTPRNLAEQPKGLEAIMIAQGKLGILEVYYQQILGELDKDKTLKFDELFQITLPERLTPKQSPRGAKKQSTVEQGQVEFV